MIYIIYSHIAILMASLEIGRLAVVASPHVEPAQLGISALTAPWMLPGAHFQKLPAASMHFWLRKKTAQAIQNAAMISPIWCIECCFDSRNHVEHMLLIWSIWLKWSHTCCFIIVFFPKYEILSIIAVPSKKTGEWSSMIQSPYDIWSYSLMICQSRHRASWNMTPTFLPCPLRKRKVVFLRCGDTHLGRSKLRWWKLWDFQVLIYMVISGKPMVIYGKYMVNPWLLYGKSMVNNSYPLVMTNSLPWFFDGPNRKRWFTVLKMMIFHGYVK